MDKRRIPYFLEANIVPGMTERPVHIGSSYFPRACYINRNISYKDTIIKIVEIAMERGIG